MTEILKAHEPQIETFELVPSGGGKFEFSVNDRLLYSKMETGRHTYPGEIASLLETYIQEKEG